MDYRRSPSAQSPFGTTRDLPSGSSTSHPTGGSANARNHCPPDSNGNFGESGQFDIVSWYHKYNSCLRYFLEVSQHDYPCQALAAFINIRLPFQKSARSPTAPPPLTIVTGGPSSGYPVPQPQFRQGFSPTSPANANGHGISPYGWVSLHPYIRRLVATGFDGPDILHGWFGDDWDSGVQTILEIERRNYLFAAKSGGWAAVKKDYDNVNDEAIPYLKPLQNVEDDEIENSEKNWSEWLAMEDWMLGSRAPGHAASDHNRMSDHD